MLSDKIKDYFVPHNTIKAKVYDNNDIEMLKRASFSFAMENAHQNVKDTANYKTKSNDEFGVEVILKELIRAKESFFNK